MQAAINDLARTIATDTKLLEQFQKDPVGSLKSAAAVLPLQTDVWIYRIVVAALALTVVSAMIGAVMLSVYGKPIPETLTALGSGALGAMAGLLVPSPSRS